MPHNTYGYYHSIWQRLASKGIASFSWDKPGVGCSDGNWLTQDMDDRAVDVREAYQSLRKNENIDTSKIGAMGFSQAGWVLPRLASDNWVDFMIFVSTAISWMEQSQYLTRQRLLADGNSSDSEIEATLTQNSVFNNALLNSLLNYDDFLKMDAKHSANGQATQSIGRGRFVFIKNNVTEDSTPLLRNIKVPVFALFGADDLQVVSTRYLRRSEFLA